MTMTNAPTPAGMVTVPIEPDAGLLSVISAMVRRIAVPVSIEDEEIYFDNGHARLIYKAVIDAAQPSAGAEPVKVTIFCPRCSLPHVDEGEWATRQHKTHQCQGCSHEWRPFPFATVGITHPAPVLMAETLEGLQNLKHQLERIAAEAPDDQPRYKNGVRPFGTGDLRHFIQVLSDATATPVQPDSGGVVEALREARKWIAGQPDRSTSVYETSFSMLEAIDAALAPVAAEEAQPVPFMFAYENVDKPGEWRAFPHQIKRADGSICPGRALYTHPAPVLPDSEKLKLREALRTIAGARPSVVKTVWPNTYKGGFDAASTWASSVALEVLRPTLRTEPTGGGEG